MWTCDFGESLQLRAYVDVRTCNFCANALSLHEKGRFLSCLQLLFFTHSVHLKHVKGKAIFFEANRLRPH